MPDRRRPLSEDELGRLARAIDPAARVVRSQPLLGGLDWGTYEVQLDAPNGVRSCVVRRYDGEGERPAASARRLWAVLTALADVDLPMPRPVLIDDGALLGAPAVVMTRCDGGIRLPPADPGDWIEAFAAALVAIHATDVERIPATLPRCLDRHADLERALQRPAEGDARPTWDRVMRALCRHADRVSEIGPVLRHCDFWFGNTLWAGDRVTGVLDWGEACVGDPRGDLGYARLDVHLVLGPAAAEVFRRAYERRRGRMADLAYFDLRATVPALIWLADWVNGYHEVGLRDLSLILARARLDAFISDAMSFL